MSFQISTIFSSYFFETLGTQRFISLKMQSIILIKTIKFIFIDFA